MERSLGGREVRDRLPRKAFRIYTSTPDRGGRPPRLLHGWHPRSERVEVHPAQRCRQREATRGRALVRHPARSPGDASPGEADRRRRLTHSIAASVYAYERVMQRSRKDRAVQLIGTGVELRLEGEGEFA